MFLELLFPALAEFGHFAFEAFGFGRQFFGFFLFLGAQFLADGWVVNEFLGLLPFSDQVAIFGIALVELFFGSFLTVID